MKITERKDKPDTRYCVRCGILESQVKREGSYGCYHYGSQISIRHSYTTNREQEKWEKEMGL